MHFKFKTGDNIECIYDTINGLTNGKIYKVIRNSSSYSVPGVIVIGDLGIENDFYESRFELVPGDRKIIGYRLLKDSPEADKGSEFYGNLSTRIFRKRSRYIYTNFI